MIKAKIIMARKRKDIDWGTVEALIQAGCEQQEIAEFLNVSVDTLQRATQREFGVNFSEHFKPTQNQSLEKSRLRIAMFRKALVGDNAKLIELSKKLLGWH